MSLLVRLGGLLLGLALAAHTPDMNNQFINLTSAAPEIQALFQIAFIVIGIGFFLRG